METEKDLDLDPDELRRHLDFVIREVKKQKVSKFGSF